MPNDFNKALGHESEALAVRWNHRDLLLYAVGVGAKATELSTVYEDHPSWAPLPVYPLVLGLKLDTDSISNFAEAKDAGGATPGMPAVEPTKVVHGSQSIQILKPLPLDSGKGFHIKKKLVAIKDTGKGLITEQEMELLGPDGTVYTRMTSGGYAFGNYTNAEDGSKGFNKSIAAAPPAQGLNKPPTRAADFTFSEKISPEQAIIYRLSGDYNSLHIDPSIGKALGFGGVILHGLCSYGHAARAILLNAAEGDNSRLEYMSARFTSPVRPGDELETKMWVSEGGKRVDFTQTVKGGKMCLGGGVAILKPKGKQSKL